MQVPRQPSPCIVSLGKFGILKINGSQTSKPKALHIFKLQ